ncbi:sensor histidine kinase [Flavilitoribacter nigricans]|uniref:histidine kinase n=1 Tax=Flavilitoribacter nigricans (strain ATCC 23147 / DSM 23189 / NBRC 102662 / NCIMB 1420 / SS-2) TaxID=1122177 RepID=A0A2D0MWR1_FLAN2|nr:ATP-binding protein [Flavilitoribacter nigricans]PHN00588.1 hypothetical protein CRP01_41455 [Flavilitoribacter nigricans DSM 23189 = NBRC 102662]
MVIGLKVMGCYFFLRKTIVSVSLIFYFPFFALCQHLSFDHLKPIDGLDDRNIDFIKKDSKGYFWFSSLEGVYNYNGFELKHLSLDNYPLNGNNGLLEKDIQGNFFEDAETNIWFTPINGINCYVREKDELLNYRIKGKNGQPAIDAGYSGFHLGNDSLLWLKADNKLYSYNIATGAQKKIYATKGYRFSVDTFANGKLKTIYACPWIRSPGIEQFSISPEQNFIVKNELFQDGLPGHPEKKPNISHVIVENDSSIWLFSQYGLIKTDPQNPDSSSLYELPSVSDSQVKDGVILNDSLIAVISKNHGLWLFNRDSSCFSKNFLSNKLIPGSISSNDLREIYLDNEELLWVSYYDKAEIGRAWVNPNDFIVPFKHQPEPDKVNSMAEDALGQIWCATQKKGLFIFDESGKLKKNILYNDGLQPITHLHKDKVGNIWAISSSQIYKFTDFAWENIYVSTEENLLYTLQLEPNKLLVSTIDSLYTLTLGKNGPEVKKLDNWGGKPIFESFYALPSKKKNIFYLLDGRGEIVIVTYENGELIPQEGGHIQIGADIYAISEKGKDDQLLVGTANGALLLDLITKEKKNIFPDHPVLKNLPVYAITRDQNDWYWLATRVGIWAYLAKTGQLYCYHTEDGLPSQEFNLYSYLETNNGKFWLGYNEGAVGLDPLSIRPYPFTPKLELRNVSINKESYDPDTLIDYKKHLILKAKENTFAMDAISISHYFPKHNRIEYLLEGYDGVKRIIANGEQIQFTKIPSGIYHLKVTPMNANGVKGKTRTLKLTIKKPFFARPEILLISLFLVAGAFYFIIRMVVKNRLRKQQRIFQHLNDIKEARQSERDRIGAEMHEDLAGGLTSIQLLAQNVRKKSKGVDVPEKLKRIEEYSAELVEGMREIIWAMNSSYDSLPDLAIYMRQFVLGYFEDLDIPCKTTIPDNFPDIIISGEKRKNLFLCLKESAHNVVKHANADFVEFSMHYAQQQLSIILKDNGKGIGEEKLRHFGNGLVNMKKRMEVIGGKMIIESQNGSSVKLILPLSEPDSRS